MMAKCCETGICRWHSWWAWHPVPKFDEQGGATWAWFKTVYRRYDPAAQKWSYAITEFDLLKVSEEEFS